MHKHPNTTNETLLMEQSLRFFPDFSDAQRARWIAAKQYVAGRFTMPIGEKAVDNPLPDFLRALPRPAQLSVDESSLEYVRATIRALERGFK